MIRVISSPSSSTTGFLTLILATPVLHTPRGSLRPLATGSRPARAVRQSGGASQRDRALPGHAGPKRRAPAPRGTGAGAIRQPCGRLLGGLGLGRGRFGRGCRRLDRDVGALAALAEADLALGHGVDRVVAAHADVGAGVPFRAALADDDVARDDPLAAVLLDAEPLAGRVAAVARATAGFLVCHDALPLAGDVSGRDYVRDADHGLELPVAVAPPVVLAPPLLEDDDLLALALLKHGRRDLGAGDGGRAHDRALAADHQHLAELDRAAGLAIEPLDDEDLVLGDAVLLAAGLDHCVHGAGAGPEIGTRDRGRSPRDPEREPRI